MTTALKSITQQLLDLSTLEVEVWLGLVTQHFAHSNLLTADVVEVYIAEAKATAS